MCNVGWKIDHKKVIKKSPTDGTTQKNQEK